MITQTYQIQPLSDCQEYIPSLAELWYEEITKHWAPDASIEKVKELNLQILYLLAFDPTIPTYYQRLGWAVIGMSEFKSRLVTVMEIDLN